MGGGERDRGWRVEIFAEPGLTPTGRAGVSSVGTTPAKQGGGTFFSEDSMNSGPRGM